MTPFFEKLPTILVLAVLVGIFVSLQTHAKSVRVKLWTVAWGLIFVHFLLQMFVPQPGLLGMLLAAGGMAFLLLASAVFLASFAARVETPRRILSRLLVIGVPAFVFGTAWGFGIESRWLYAACLAAIFGYGTLLSLWPSRKLSLYRGSLAAAWGLVGVWTIYAVLHGSYDEGYLALLALGFALPGVFFWRRYRRLSPGVLTVVGGFLCWGAIFPASMLVSALFPQFAINPELWNVPKFFVAFGMILTLIEDKSKAVEEARERAHEINAQLQRFARITSRLLTGAEFQRLCQEIAIAITETSTFQRAAILLANEHQRLHLAGQSGIAPDAQEEIRQRSHSWTTSLVETLCSGGEKIGQCSRLLGPEQIAKYDLALEGTQPAALPSLPDKTEAKSEAGDELLIPLFFSHGKPAGCVLLDHPRERTHVNPDEISRIELLAGDLAISIENTALHRQLIRSEKLAALGQLVAGVAHELNNPLTSVIGYGELIADDVKGEVTAEKMDALLREANRMKRIVQNLLRFARQGASSRRVANVLPAITQVLMLREYYLKQQNIDIRTSIAPNLPSVGITEDEFKQVILNLLNNAIDAVENLPDKSIDLACTTENNTVRISIADNGPGFANLDRAFDPFYTTKPIGKGTGLGLSICYGIVKEHGGEIYIHNLHPCGARVVVELPAVSAYELSLATVE